MAGPLEYAQLNKVLYDAAIQGQKDPIELDKMRLANALSRENIATSQQNRDFAAQKQPSILEQLSLGNAGQRIKNEEGIFNNQVNSLVGPRATADAKLQDFQQKKTAGMDKAMEGLNQVVELAKAGASPEERFNFMKSRGMPEQFAQKFSILSPEQLSKAVEDMALSTQRGAIEVAKWNARAAQENNKLQTQGQQRLEQLTLQGNQAAARQMNALIAAMSRLQYQEGQRNQRAEAANTVRREGFTYRKPTGTQTSEKMYPSGITTSSQKNAYDTLSEEVAQQNPDKTGEEIKKFINEGLLKDFTLRNRFNELSIGYDNQRRARDEKPNPLSNMPGIKGTPAADALPPIRTPGRIENLITNKLPAAEQTPTPEPLGTTKPAAPAEYQNLPFSEWKAKYKNSGLSDADLKKLLSDKGITYK